MKNVYITCFLIISVSMIAMSQSRIEKNGSPDFMLHNSMALNVDVTSRMLFKSGNYYTGGIATTGAGTANARLSFFTLASTDQSGLLERMTILNNGFVGINNNNPLHPLHLKSGGIGFTQESSTGEAKIGFYTSASQAYVQTHNNVAMQFATNNGISQMTLTTTGRFGIGTTTPGSKLDVRGKTTLVQQGGDDAALEINGGIKVTGSNPSAFVVTATETDWILIDHPSSNGNPDAIILITNRTGLGPAYAGSAYVTYVNSMAKWLIIPVGFKMDGIYVDQDIRRCDGSCLATDGIPKGSFSSFDLGVQFNVLVIDK